MEGAPAAGEDDKGEKTLGEEIVQIREAIAKRAQPKMDALKKSCATTWIAQMRFARRAEGIKQARAVFAKARKSAYLPWQVIEASGASLSRWLALPSMRILAQP
jgi:cleavage stimulation factor subunit 3